MRNGTTRYLVACGLLVSLWSAPEAAAQTQVGTEFTYQGQLQEDGSPASGSYDLRFILYDSEVGGSQVGPTESIEDVTVTDGLFEVDLDFGAGSFVGNLRWLEIGVRDGASTGTYSTLSNRQPIKPAPYAIGLRPGSRIQQTATGLALRADSTEGIGFAGLGQVYGVYGGATGTQDGSGYGGYFESSTGIGVHGRSSASRSTQSPEAPGVHGWSQHGVGVLGESDSSFGTGVRGQVATGTAVQGRASGGFGILGTSPAFAVRGHSSASTSGEGYGGHFTSTTGTGVYGESTAAPSTQNPMPSGVWGYSDNGAGVRGVAGSGFAWAGFFDGDVRIEESLIVGDSIFAADKSGYVFDVAVNEDSEPLTRGDVVVMTGFADEWISDRIPVAKVRLARDMEDTAVMGVVDRRRIEDDNGMPEMVEEPAHPNDHVGVVTLGAFMSVKVDASYGPVAAGDLLVSSPTPGHAMRADNPPTGTVIGKAMDEWDTGTGSVPVMVTLH